MPTETTPSIAGLQAELERVQRERNGSKERLDFMERSTLPELRRTSDWNRDAMKRWRDRARTAEAEVQRLLGERADTNAALADVTVAQRTAEAQVAVLEPAAVYLEVADECDKAGAAYAGRSQNDHADAAFELMDTFRRKAGQAQYVATPCDFVACEPGGEPCDTHERLMAHAEGEHELCAADCWATGLRDRISEVLWPLTDWDGDQLNAERAADAVLAVLPAPAVGVVPADEDDDELVCVDECGSCDACGMEVFGTPAEGWREAARFLRRTARQSGDRQGAIHGARLIEAELRRLAGEARDERETQAEDPARIDRMRPEFTDHASVESIDVQIRRARSQLRRWHLRVEWLISLRQARVTQKELGEWPAAVSQPDLKPEAAEGAQR
jgi:hypothetical protein